MSATVTRLIQLGASLQRLESISTDCIATKYGVSKATAKRDLARLQEALDTVTETRPQGRGGYVRLVRLRGSR